MGGREGGVFALPAYLPTYLPLSKHFSFFKKKQEGVVED